jgi:mRNA (guanine-N7-)-methyltransferase
VRVLDLCCGKGGDLLKWQIGEIDEILMTGKELRLFKLIQWISDVADVSIAHAKDRYNDTVRKMERQRKRPFKATFLVADAGDCCLAEQYEPKDREFDLVSCQFALHYSFADEERAWQFLKNATERIRPGGYFIGTLPDAYQIV